MKEKKRKETKNLFNWKDRADVLMKSAGGNKRKRRKWKKKKRKDKEWNWTTTKKKNKRRKKIKKVNQTGDCK